MHYRIIILLLLMLGCAPFPERVETPAAPSVIHLTPLPPLTDLSLAAKPELSAYFLIREDGTVEEVRLISPSGDPEWEKAAVDSLKKWRFTSPNVDRDIGERWIRYRIQIEIEEPVFLNLGEIVVYSKTEADSLYQLLREGTDFLSIARQMHEETKQPMGRYIGTVNIAHYPEYVRNRLMKLRASQFTRPIKLGDTFVIFKRFEARHTPENNIFMEKI